MSFVIELLRYLTLAYTKAWRLWDWIWYADSAFLPHARYFLSDLHTFDTEYTRVPEDAVYIEEWVYGSLRRNVVRYEGEEIPTCWDICPIDKVPRRPWIWVGDKNTEIDLTRTFDKFLVVGNRITLDLVLKLIQVTDRTNLVYIERGSFRELNFPGDGILIEEDVDGC